MQALTLSTPLSPKTIWATRIVRALPVLFLIFDGGIKVLRLAPAVESTVQLGYPAGVVFGLGLVELVCLALYVVPRTSFLGALLLTGFLGGAVATHVRMGSPVFSLVFPLIVGALLWGGLFLRDARVRSLLLARHSA
jgi:hypothetical protein